MGEHTNEHSLEIARGAVKDVSHVNKFGRSENVDASTFTDIWDGSNVTTDQKKWVPPTQSRIHDIVSAASGDMPSRGGAGILTITGLQNWDSLEKSEDVTLDGSTAVATASSYCIIHRMSVKSWGASNANIGTITATAQTDNTITAMVLPSEGQTQMAIYGLSSKTIGYMTNIYANTNKSGGAAAFVDIQLQQNDIPDQQLGSYKVKHTFGLSTTGTSAFTHIYNPYKLFKGPSILKVRCNSTANNMDVSAGFDIIIVN